MKIKQKTKKWRCLAVSMSLSMSLTLSCLALAFAGCADDAQVKAVYDPSVAPVIESFTPDSGRVATQMLIYGSNFGSDLSLIKAFVNDKPAAVIGVTDDGKVLYAIVPSRARNDDGACSVKVQVGAGDAAQTAVASRQFEYALSQNVSTLAGFTDRDGNTAIVDGTLAEAQFNEPYWLAFDENHDLYLIEENNGLRFIDFDRNPATQVIERGVVSTKFRTGGGVDRPRTIAFTLDWDTMLIVNDGGDWTSIGTILLLKDTVNPTNSFKSWTTVANHKQCNGGAIHPQSNTYFFNSYEQSQVYKMKRGTPPWTYTELYKVQDRNWEFNIQFAPSGDFAYIVSVNQHYIAKSEYDREKDELKPPTVFAGTKQRSGYQDGVGTNVLFNTPHQGAFDEDDNFYLCDALNHCIRKITPDGQVSTFAGRPQNYGYSDGALRDAQFDRPFGIAYDAAIQTFFIADQKNRRIRTITI